MNDPWTDPDPQPGDFDSDLAALDPKLIAVREGNPDAKLTMIVGLSTEDARRLAELAAERGNSVEQVVSELVRNA